MKTRQFILNGYQIDVFNFGNSSYMYPEFNHNAEFECSSKGLRKLSHYLRTVNYFKSFIKLPK